MAELARTGVFDDLAVATPAASLSPVPSAVRFNLRARGSAVGPAGEAFGLTLPLEACRSVSDNDRAALWLGPDEWLLLAPDGSASEITESFATTLGKIPYSLVEVSHRLSALTIIGPQAATILNEACPLDLDPAAFPVGMSTRTVFGKAEIILWRIARDGFRLEVARSFAAYVRALLDVSHRQFGP
jgi:sarcosine oxidase subunit gamma